MANKLKHSAILWSGVATVILLSFVAYKQYGNEPVAEAVQTAEPFKVTPPYGEDIDITGEYIGQVEAINQTQIVPYISGYVMQIVSHGGQEVKKGEVLAVIKQEEYLAHLAAAKAEVFSAKANYVNAKVKYERMQKAGTTAVSPTELDNAKAEFLTASGNLEKAEADYMTAQTNYDYTYLKAPFDGVLGNIALSVGDYVSPQSNHLIDLVQYSPIRVVFAVTDKEYLNYFNKADKAPLSVKAKLANGEILKQNGSIKYTANSVDKKTNSIAVYTEFENPEKLLMPNGYVQILLHKHYKNAVLLAKDQVLLKPDGDYVYTIADGILKLHKVHIYGETENKYVCKNDFSENEFIVLGAVENRLAGQKVEYQLVNREA